MENYKLGYLDRIKQQLNIAGKNKVINYFNRYHRKVKSLLLSNTEIPEKIEKKLIEKYGEKYWRVIYNNAFVYTTKKAKKAIEKLNKGRLDKPKKLVELELFLSNDKFQKECRYVDIANKKYAILYVNSSAFYDKYKKDDEISLLHLEEFLTDISDDIEACNTIYHLLSRLNRIVVIDVKDNLNNEENKKKINKINKRKIKQDNKQKYCYNKFIVYSFDLHGN